MSAINVWRAQVVPIVLATCLLTTLTSAASAQYDPFVGTWELNLRESTFHPGPPPKRQTLTCRASVEGLRSLLQGVDAQGRPIDPDTTKMAINFDGQDHPTPQRDYDSSAWIRISAHEYQVTHKRAGHVVLTSTYVLSDNGKTLIVTAEGVDADGRLMKNVRVYSKK